MYSPSRFASRQCCRRLATSRLHIGRLVPIYLANVCMPVPTTSSSLAKVRRKLYKFLLHLQVFSSKRHLVNHLLIRGRFLCACLVNRRHSGRRVRSRREGSRSYWDLVEWIWFTTLTGSKPGTLVLMRLRSNWGRLSPRRDR